MELVFLLTGWEFAREGKKATEFSELCQALGVEFSLQHSADGRLLIGNTEQRRKELIVHLEQVISARKLSRHEALVLRGRLGFADSFMHGRLGRWVLSRLIEHAYGTQPSMNDSMVDALSWMKSRLESTKPREVNSETLDQFFLFTDAAYEPDTQTGGMGAVLVNSYGTCVAWFGIFLDTVICGLFGAQDKDTIIYELEMLAAVFSICFWQGLVTDSYTVCCGDNEAVRFAPIKGAAQGVVGQTLMRELLSFETHHPTNLWFARVPTEANIADPPSRFESHPLLESETCVSNDACKTFFDFVAKCKNPVGFRRNLIGARSASYPNFHREKCAPASFSHDTKHV